MTATVMHMKQLVVCIAFLVVGCSTEKTSVEKQARTSDSHSEAELAEVLTAGSWVKDLGEGPFSERWVYRFYNDGTYTQQIFTDFTSSPVQGEWELSRTNVASQKLTLFGLESGEYYWLGEESFVRYNRRTDSLVVTGPRYVGEQRLRHETKE